MIYDRLRSVRAAAGLTLEDLAERCGIAAPNLSRLENGRVDARVSSIERVLAACGFELAFAPIRRTSLTDVRSRMAEGSHRLLAAGLASRDVAARLEWKDDRGLDTTVERRMIAVADGSE